MRDSALQSLRDLIEVIELLRAPGGCPWDREQTHASLSPHLLEETYETLEAIDSGRPDRLREELGDLLLQVVMHSTIAAEDLDDGFDIGDVADGLREKMVGRHPHVFSGAEVTGAADVVINWERLKANEKVQRLSLLDGVSASLPALVFALGVQKRPARVGFDTTPSVAAALAGVRAALESLSVAATSLEETQARGEDWAAAAHATVPPHAASVPAGGADSSPYVVRADSAQLDLEVGELLFAVVALARRLRVNPEDSLRRRATRFGELYRRLEAGIRLEGRDVHATSAEQWDRLRQIDHKS